MTRWIKSLFAWRTVFEAGVYAYQENAVTLRRRHVRIVTGGWSPVDRHWLSRTRRTSPRLTRYDKY